MSGNSTESATQDMISDDGPDEFDVAMDAFASGTEPPADNAAGHGGTDPNEGQGDDTQQPGSEQEAGVSEPAAGAAPPADSQSTDIWASAPEEYRTAFENYKRDSEYRQSSLKGRLSASDRELARLRASQQTQQPSRQSGDDSGASDENDPFNPQRMAQLREEYGEVAGPLLDMVDALKGNVDQLRAPVAVIEQEQQLAQYHNQVDALATKHPDWQTAFSNEAFPAWLEQQPALIRTAIERNANTIVDGEEAALVLDLFKRDIGAGQTPPPPTPQKDQQDQNRLSDRRQKQLEAGRDAAIRGGQAATAGVPDDYEAAQDYYAAKADADRKR